LHAGENQGYARISGVIKGKSDILRPTPTAATVVLQTSKESGSRARDVCIRNGHMCAGNHKVATVVKHKLATTDAQIFATSDPLMSDRFCVSDYRVRLPRNSRLDLRGDAAWIGVCRSTPQLLIDL
jgi:hypothetical protein